MECNLIVRKNKILTEIVILRVIAIVGVVLYHSFSTVYNLSAPNYMFNLIFKEGFMIFSLNMAMLTLFTFISGYLFSFNQYRNKRTFNEIMLRATKRLLLPYIVFALLFSIFPFPLMWHMDVVLRSIIVGSGHLWFLLMLYFCFGVMALIQKSKKFWGLVLLLYILYYSLNYSTYPFLVRIFSFERFLILLPWFILGYYVNKYSDDLLNFFVRWKFISVVIIYILLISINIYKHKVWAGFSFYTIDNFDSFGGQLLAILILWVVSNKIQIQPTSKMWLVFKKIDTQSFGIYIFHLLVINLILSNDYIRSNMIKYHILLSPVILFIASFGLSLFITKIFKKFKFGRTLLG